MRKKLLVSLCVAVVGAGSAILYNTYSRKEIYDDPHHEWLF